VTAIPPRATAKKPARTRSTTKVAPAKKAAAKTTKKSAPKEAVKAKPAAKAALKKAAPKAVKNTPAQNATEALCKRIQGVLDTNKAEDIATLTLRDKCSFADFMIVANGRAPRHVVALADYVADLLKKSGSPALSIEGKESGDWVLIDAGDIIVHIFRPEVRQFYNIEKMWALPVASY
jgi:ribosome-associated protein